jgi:hypothetical protein
MGLACAYFLFVSMHIRILEKIVSQSVRRFGMDPNSPISGTFSWGSGPESISGFYAVPAIDVRSHQFTKNTWILSDNNFSMMV